MTRLATAVIFDNLISFAGLANLVPYGDINDFFTGDYRARQADGLRPAGSPRVQRAGYGV
mgnify:CR=1 FL=1